jgi:hypothetical protein
MQDTQTATILAFPVHSVPRRNLSLGQELERLERNLIVLAAALRGCGSAIENLALALAKTVVDKPCD